MIAASPNSFYGLFRQALRLDEPENEKGRFVFDVEYSYEPPEATRRWSFDTTGGTTRLYVSDATTSYGAPSFTAPDYKNAINVSDGKVEGVDITVPALKLTCTYTHTKLSSIVNASTIDAYIKTLATISGTTNESTRLTYAAGELLFLGATGEYVPDRPTELQYHFIASANATGISIGDILSVAKKGHQFLWVLFEENENSGSDARLVRRPLACYVEDVYRESDLSVLGIF